MLASKFTRRHIVCGLDDEPAVTPKMGQDCGVELAAEIEKYASANPRIAIAAARIGGGRVETAYRNCGPETRFELGSITKVITAVLLCEAVAAGKCGFDDPVDNWLPDGVLAPHYFGRRITLYQLATHTSGLPRLPLGMFFDGFLSKQPYANWDRRRLLRAIRRARVERTPGSMYAYSNFGFAVLGVALEQITGQPYRELVSDLTSRLNCPEVRLFESEDVQVTPEGHNKNGQAVIPWEMAEFAPAGGCTSTLEGILGFAKCNLDPADEPFLLDAMTNRRRFKARPAVGSGIPRTVLCAVVALLVSLGPPPNFFIPLMCVEIAAFGAGALGGGLVMLAWETAAIWQHSAVAVIGERFYCSLFAITIALWSLNKKPVQELGIGWHVSTPQPGRVIHWHNGGTAGFRTFMGVERVTGKAVVVLAARAKSVDDLAIRLLN